MKKVLKNKYIIQSLYFIIILVILYFYKFIDKSGINDALVAFLVIDISNTERKNLKKRARVYFYDSLSIISRSIVCGFIAPLFFIFFLGNVAGLAYVIIYNIAFENEYTAFRFIFTILIILPCFITEILIYVIYAARNKKISIDFKGDFILNSFCRPLLNVDIMAAYIESVNFYYYFNKKDVEYLKSYGEYKNKIDTVCVNDYLGVAYGLCMLTFVVFFISLNLR